MKTFTKKQQEEDLRCRVATTFAKYIPKFKIHEHEGDLYISKDGTPKTCWVILSDGENHSANFMFTNNNSKNTNDWIEYQVNKENVTKRTGSMYPVECFVEEVEQEIVEISKHYR